LKNKEKSETARQTIFGFVSTERKMLRASHTQVIDLKGRKKYTHEINKLCTELSTE